MPPLHDAKATVPGAAALRAAIALIASTPGYAAAGADLTDRLARGRIRFAADMSDRGQATLTGVLLIGREAIVGGPLGLAETLIHERHHACEQRPLEKTASFWAGVATRTPMMRRYEAPAYRAALAFLEAVARARPELADTARREQAAIRASFAALYGGAP